MANLPDVKEIIAKQLRKDGMWDAPERDPARRAKILSVIAALWEHHPNMRLGQLLVNFTNAADFEHNVYWFEDDALLEQLSNYARAFE